MDDYDLDSDKQRAARWAYELVNDPAGFVVLDTETTGLGPDAEACQIAVVDQDGVVLLDTLVKPTVPIPPGATAVHGIDDAMVADAPSFVEVLSRLTGVLVGRLLVIYNAGYDLDVLDYMVHQALPAAPQSFYSVTRYRESSCAMLCYASFYGDWNAYRGDYRWQKLGAALEQLGIEHTGTLHSALGDCQATLEVIRAMAAWYTEQIAAPESDERSK